MKKQTNDEFLEGYRKMFEAAEKLASDNIELTGDYSEDKLMASVIMIQAREMGINKNLVEFIADTDEAKISFTLSLN